MPYTSGGSAIFRGDEAQALLGPEGAQPVPGASFWAKLGEGWMSGHGGFYGKVGVGNAMELFRPRGEGELR